MSTEVRSLISAVEVAQMFGVTPVTVYRWAKAGTLPMVGRLPGKTGAYLFDADAVGRLSPGGRVAR